MNSLTNLTVFETYYSIKTHITNEKLGNKGFKSDSPVILNYSNDNLQTLYAKTLSKREA